MARVGSTTASACRTRRPICACRRATTASWSRSNTSPSRQGRVLRDADGTWRARPVAGGSGDHGVPARRATRARRSPAPASALTPRSRSPRVPKTPWPASERGCGVSPVASTRTCATARRGPPCWEGGTVPTPRRPRRVSCVPPPKADNVPAEPSAGAGDKLASSRGEPWLGHALTQRD